MEEKMRILKMLEDGTITAGEAAELMDALDTGSRTDTESTGLMPAETSYEKKMLRIQVAGKDNVNIQFPISAVRKILKITGKLPIPQDKLNGVDLDGLMEAVCECLDEEIVGDFVNVSASDGTTVRICVD